MSTQLPLHILQAAIRHFQNGENDSEPSAYNQTKNERDNLPEAGLRVPLATITNSRNTYRNSSDKSNKYDETKEQSLKFLTSNPKTPVRKSTTPGPLDYNYDQLKFRHRSPTSTFGYHRDYISNNYGMSPPTTPTTSKVGKRPANQPSAFKGLPTQTKHQQNDQQDQLDEMYLQGFLEALYKSYADELQEKKQVSPAPPNKIPLASTCRTPTKPKQPLKNKTSSIRDNIERYAPTSPSNRKPPIPTSPTISKTIMNPTSVASLLQKGRYSLDNEMISGYSNSPKFRQTKRTIPISTQEAINQNHAHMKYITQQDLYHPEIADMYQNSRANSPSSSTGIPSSRSHRISSNNHHSDDETPGPAYYHPVHPNWTPKKGFTIPKAQVKKSPYRFEKSEEPLPGPGDYNPTPPKAKGCTIPKARSRSHSSFSISRPRQF